MPTDPMEVVFALLEARRQSDLDGVRCLLHPDVVHEGVTPQLLCNNREEVLHNVRRGFGREEGIDHLELVRAGDDHVILGLAGPGFREAPWAQQSDALFIVHTVRDGLVVRMRDFVDRDAAFDSVGAKVVDWT